MILRKLLLTALCLAALPCWAQSQTAPAETVIDAAVIDAEVQRAMQTFEVPGLALSVVRNGQVVYASGHGLREIWTEDPVDDDTLFQIASVSKAFTAAALAVLADEGRLHWDDPVTDFIPEFRMYDPWVTREFTVRDLLTHRSGLPLGAGDLLFWPDGDRSTVDDVIAALGHLRPSSSFRSKYDYDNLMYVVAGEIVARVSGQPYAEFVENRLLGPLGMDDCRGSLARTADQPNQATPHLLMDGEWEITATGSTDMMAAAGGINCSARSMTRWMTMLLNDGRTPDGDVLISEAQVTELFKPVTLMGVSTLHAEHAGVHMQAYALGWGVSSFYGQPAYRHSGGLWGMTTHILLLPRQNLALFASNNLMSRAPMAVVDQVAAMFLGQDTDWIGLFSELSSSRSEEAEAVVAAAAAARDADSTPSLPLERYAGRYRDPWYGDVILELRDGTLWFVSERSKNLQGPLEHFQYDTFIARWTNRQLMADAYVSFVLSPEGGVERIRMKAVSPATDFSYDFHDLDLQKVTESQGPP